MRNIRNTVNASTLICHESVVEKQKAMKKTKDGMVSQSDIVIKCLGHDTHLAIIYETLESRHDQTGCREGTDHDHHYGSCLPWHD